MMYVINIIPKHQHVSIVTEDLTSFVISADYFDYCLPQIEITIYLSTGLCVLRFNVA